ncbi:aminotransferase class V-fold PLP-dependent enzyme [Phycisphaerales bacterium AB-hyl4]|uniref:cysteine desulfurase n=1 Tax=Natronomicrosphaera hydrolytica TaxID=3242702 RepID=A0ABV4U657_9BACT
MPRRLYMDNAATSFPKPPGVLAAMTRFATELGASPGRGAYAEAQEAGQLMHQCRERINTLIHGENPDHVVFTLNTTDALNLAIHGITRAARASGRSPHVITTWMDHNSVLRPFNMMARHDGVQQTRVECNPDTGLVDPGDIQKAITPDTCLIAVVHGSNVTGTVQPVAEIGAIARRHDIPFLVDAAQTLGHMPLDVQRDHIDLLAAPGHKGLLGPLGTGMLYIRPGIEKLMHTVREGGTGSVSEDDTQPDFMPDRFEPGSHNAIGILGLSEGVQYILDQGIDNLWQHEQQLVATMVAGLADLPGLTVYGPPDVNDRCGVFSVRVVPGTGYDDPRTLSDVLESEFGILTRSGIHCAPLAHKTFNTHELAGTTRLSFGPYLTVEDVQYACDALTQIAQRAVADEAVTR